jgi:CTP synthase (UTP-ammonia lyase)
MGRPVITVLVDLAPAQAYRVATLDALKQAQAATGIAAEVRVVPTATISDDLIEAPGDGVLVGPGSPYDNPEGVLDVIRAARIGGIPLVGT